MVCGRKSKKIYGIVVKKINVFKYVKKKKIFDFNSFFGDLLKFWNFVCDLLMLICYNIISIFRFGLGVKFLKILLFFIYFLCNNFLDR